MEKDRSRGERRDRSYKKFMRRLKADQQEHGRRADLDGTPFCPCFYDPKEQARFKDTPKNYKCNCCGSNKRVLEGDTIQEKRQADIERDKARKNTKNPNLREYPKKICCRTCGYFIRYAKKEEGMRWMRCERCEKKSKEKS